MYHVPDPIAADLWVIAPLFNPIRYKSRWKHLHRFVAHVRASGAKLLLVEAAFGARAFATSPAMADQWVGVRTGDELWIKESLINLALTRLPDDARYVAWIDADVAFARPNWVGETIHQLQHYDLVQLFTRAQDLGPTYEPVGSVRQSFADAWRHGTALGTGDGYSNAGTATGLAWAARRAALDAVGGLIDFCILGSADWHMAHALIGRVEQSRPDDLVREYKAALEEWQLRAQRARLTLGAVSGLVLHYWHGRKADRHYRERWRPLIEHQFDPSIDLKRNTYGVWQWCDHGTPRSAALQACVQAYLRARNEDSLDV